MNTKISENKDQYQDKVIDINKICRLCIKESSPLYCVQGKIGDEDCEIAQVISICYRITVEEDQKICEECLVKLDMFYSVITEVLRSNKEYDLLLRLFEKLKTINIPVKESGARLENVQNNTDTVKVEVKLEEGLAHIDLDEFNAEPENIDEERSVDNEAIEKEEEEMKLSLRKTKKSKTFNESKKILAKYKKKKYRKVQKCNICRIKVDDLDEHFEGHYEIELKCDYCPEVTFESLQELSEHMPTHTKTNKPIKCNYCSKEFYLLAAKRHHLDQHTMADVEAAKKRKRPRIVNTPCTHCGKIFSTNNLLRDHERRMHRPDLGVLCQLCDNDKRFPTNTTLKVHMRTVHSNEKPFICEYCAKNFKTRHHLNLHIRVHSDVLPFHCDDCNRDFRSTSWLHRHKTEKGCAPTRKNVKRKNRTLVRKMKCSFCGIKVDNSEMYQNHVENKHPSECYKCGYCEKQLESFAEYQIHQQNVHSEEETTADIGYYLPCPHCDRVFHDSSMLSAHLKQQRHIFTCSYCSKVFSFRANMERHIDVVHLKKRAFECEFCHKAFGQIGSWQTHLRTHTGEKPYSCMICNTSYADHSTLYKHKKKHHI